MFYFLNKEFNLENMNQTLSEFKCQRCKSPCCLGTNLREYGAALLKHELSVLARIKGISTNQFRTRYCYTKNSIVHLILPCVFYDYRVGGCSIWMKYGKKMLPQVCVTFPFNKHIEKNGKSWMICGDCDGGKKYAEEHQLLPEDYRVLV